MNFAPIRSVLRNKNDHVCLSCLFNGLSAVRWQQSMRKATSTRIPKPTMSRAVIAPLHAESDKLDHKTLSRAKRESKDRAEAAQTRPLAVGTASTSENTVKSTSANESIPSDENKSFAPGSRRRAILRNLSHTLLSSLVKGGTSGVKSLKAWLEQFSDDVPNTKEIQVLIDKLSRQSAVPTGKNMSRTIGPHAGTSKKSTALLEGVLNRESTSKAISQTTIKKGRATDVTPTSCMAQSVKRKSHVSSTGGGEKSTAPESQKQRKPSSLDKKTRTSRAKRVSRRTSSLRIRRVAATQQNVISSISLILTLCLTFNRQFSTLYKIQA